MERCKLTTMYFMEVRECAVRLFFVSGKNTVKYRLPVTFVKDIVIYQLTLVNYHLCAIIIASNEQAAFAPA